jgi:DNA-binding NarL/FixJ family response regulator
MTPKKGPSSVANPYLPTGSKIIAITAYALEGDQELCLEAGMDGYIAKTVIASDLVEALKKHQPSQDILVTKRDLLPLECANSQSK